MKKGKYWFSKLSHKQKGQFRRNVKNQTSFYELFEYKMSSDYNNFMDFLSKGFLWITSNEGFRYWSKLSDKNIK